MTRLMNRMGRWTWVSIGLVCWAARPAAADNDASLHYLLANVLHRHVSQGLVDYESLKKDEDLGKYLNSLAKIDPDKDLSSDSARIAFWINAYNAMVLQGICDAWPIAKLSRRHAIYRRQFTIGGRQVSPEQVQNDILRKKYRDPRILMALCIGAKDGPPLRTRPYYGSDLEATLIDQTIRYLNVKDRIRLLRIRDEVFIPELFRWYEKDFTRKGGVHVFIARHLKNETLSRYMAAVRPKIRYTFFDWSVNAVPAEK